jgi:uncharacterized protein YfiM (DUF2279 family)
MACVVSISAPADSAQQCTQAATPATICFSSRATATMVAEKRDQLMACGGVGVGVGVQAGVVVVVEGCVVGRGEAEGEGLVQGPANTFRLAAAGRQGAQRQGRAGQRSPAGRRAGAGADLRGYKGRPAGKGLEELPH